MKFKSVGCLSSAIVYCLSINSVFALSKVPEPVRNQASPAQTELVISNNLFKVIDNNVRRVNRINQNIRREQRRQQMEERREQYRQLMEQRRLELEAARRAATEEQRLEAERRRQYFESLSPEDQRAYIAKQQAMQVQRDQTAILFMLGLGAMIFGGGGSSDSVGSDEGVRTYLCVVGYDSNGRSQEAYVQMTKEMALSRSMCSPS